MSEPLVRVLRMVDGDNRPSMRYLYDDIHHAKKKKCWGDFERERLKWNLS